MKFGLCSICQGVIFQPALHMVDHIALCTPDVHTFANLRHNPFFRNQFHQDTVFLTYRVNGWFFLVHRSGIIWIAVRKVIQHPSVLLLSRYLLTKWH